MSFLVRLTFLLLATCLPFASGATDVLGYTLSTTTLQQFLKQEQSNPSLARLPATDKFILNGYVLKPKLSEFGSTERVGFMFDRTDRLCMVIVEVPYDRYAELVNAAKTKYEFVGEKKTSSGTQEAHFHAGTDHISIEGNPERPKMSVMLMNEQYKKDSDARLKANGFRPTFD